MISSNLKRSFNITIIGLISIECLIGLIALLRFDYRFFTPFAFWIDYLVYPLQIIKSVAIFSLVRHLHDQINTYYKAQKGLNIIGNLSAYLVSVGAFLLLLLRVKIQGSATYSNVLPFYVFGWIGVILFAIWIFNISRSLRFLNLISSVTYMVGVVFSLVLLILVVGEFVMVVIPNASVQLLRTLQVCGVLGSVLGVSYYVLLHRSLTR